MLNSEGSDEGQIDNEVAGNIEEKEEQEGNESYWRWSDKK